MSCEQVILNRQGKRVIRLDAWAMSEDERQFNMEMQNDSKGEDIPKRSRFYQGLIDTPTLKAGRYFWKGSCKIYVFGTIRRNIRFIFGRWDIDNPKKGRLLR